MQISMTKQVPVEAKTLKLHMKVCDQFEADLEDQDGQTLKRYEGYVPKFMPGDHYGDYLILDIDIDTGQIVNWTKPDAEELEAFISDD
jgi:hypothetical protein